VHRPLVRLLWAPETLSLLRAVYARPSFTGGTRKQPVRHCAWSCTRTLRIIVSPRKLFKMPPLHHCVRGVAMILIMFTTSWRSWDVCGSALCCIMAGRADPPGHIKRSAKPIPLKCKRIRSTAPKPFEGLTQRPHCAACAYDANHPHAPPRCDLIHCHRPTDAHARLIPPAILSSCWL